MSARSRRRIFAIRGWTGRCRCSAARRDARYDGRPMESPARTDASRREFLAALAAAGVSTTFLDEVLAQAATTEPAMPNPSSNASPVPHPANEEIFDSHVGNL